jgi:peptidoglycan/LPS O-acetylase OafA/YrhL
MTAEGGPGRIRYIPALDGIRGLLLPGVILVHYTLFLGNRPGLPGWMRHVGLFSLNIQMFFVLSGALITSLLVAEHQRTGTASLKQFYLRRSRRLGPALVTVLPLMFIAEIAWTGSRGSSPLGSHPWLALAAVAVFVGNWVLFRITGGIGWLGPAWTLGIEEQFYLTWPILLRLGLKRRVSRAAIHAAFGFAAVMSIVFATYLYNRYGSARTYYATPTQLPSIIVGCALGYELTANPVGRIARLMRLRAIGAAGLAGTVLVSVALADHDRYIYRGGYLIYALVACLLVGHCFVVAGEETVVTRVLAWRPFKVMGQISYEAYLIHVIVIIAVAQALPHLHVYPMIVLDSIIVGALSLSFYYLVEQPIRRDGWREFFAGARHPVPAVRGAFARQPFAVTGGLVTAAAAFVAVTAIAVTNVGTGARPGRGQTVSAQPGINPVAPVVSARPVVGGGTHGSANHGTNASVVPVTGGSSSPHPATGVLLDDPVITRVTPAAGPLAGGTTVTLIGSQLDKVNDVRFGAASAQTFTIVSPSEIWAVAPATSHTGRVPITVQAAGGRTEAACVGECVARFAYLAVPTITGLTAPIGHLTGGTPVTIRGSGFAPGIEVYFGSFRIDAVDYVNSKTLRITAPPERLLGLGDAVHTLRQISVQVRVKTPGGVSKADLISRFTYL